MMLMSVMLVISSIGLVACNVKDDKDSDGALSFNDKLQSGEYTVKITPYDVYGKVGTSISKTFTI